MVRPLLELDEVLSLDGHDLRVVHRDREGCLFRVIADDTVRFLTDREIVLAYRAGRLVRTARLLMPAR